MTICGLTYRVFAGKQTHYFEVRKRSRGIFLGLDYRNGYGRTKEHLEYKQGKGNQRANIVKKRRPRGEEVHTRSEERVCYETWLRPGAQSDDFEVFDITRCSHQIKISATARCGSVASAPTTHVVDRDEQDRPLCISY